MMKWSILPLYAPHIMRVTIKGCSHQFGDNVIYPYDEYYGQLPLVNEFAFEVLIETEPRTCLMIHHPSNTGLPTAVT